MRATMKFAVICVSLIIAAHADAADQRNQMNALDFNAGRGYGLSWNVPTKIYDTQETLSPPATTCLR